MKYKVGDIIEFPVVDKITPNFRGATAQILKVNEGTQYLIETTFLDGTKRTHLDSCNISNLKKNSNESQWRKLTKEIK